MGYSIHEGLLAQAMNSVVKFIVRSYQNTMLFIHILLCCRLFCYLFAIYHALEMIQAIEIETYIFKINLMCAKSVYIQHLDLNFVVKLMISLLFLFNLV